MNPIRLRLSRAKGFNLQAASMAINGLCAVNVARPSKHGNKYRVGVDGTPVDCVAKFEADWQFGLSHALGQILLQTSLDNMRGKNLACWCDLSSVCHADVLLRLANQ